MNHYVFSTEQAANTFCAALDTQFGYPHGAPDYTERYTASEKHPTLEKWAVGYESEIEDLRAGNPQLFADASLEQRTSDWNPTGPIIP